MKRSASVLRSILRARSHARDVSRELRTNGRESKRRKPGWLGVPRLCRCVAAGIDRREKRSRRRLRSVHSLHSFGHAEHERGPARGPVMMKREGSWTIASNLVENHILGHSHGVGWGLVPERAIDQNAPSMRGAGFWCISLHRPGGTERGAASVPRPGGSHRRLRPVNTRVPQVGVMRQRWRVVGWTSSPVESEHLRNQIMEAGQLICVVEMA